MTADELAHLRQLCAAATPGPWFDNSYSMVASAPQVDLEWQLEKEHEAAGEPWTEAGDYPEPFATKAKKIESTVCWVPAHHGDTAVGRHEADMQFIAAARAAVPALLDALDLATEESREAWQEIERLREALKWTLSECKSCTSDAERWEQYIVLAYPPIG